MDDLTDFFGFLYYTSCPYCGEDEDECICEDEYEDDYDEDLED